MTPDAPDAEEEIQTSPEIVEVPKRVFDKPPFPQRLVSKKKAMDLSQFNEIKSIFQNLTINVPFLTAIKNMPAYARYLKELCTIKRNHVSSRNAFKVDHIDSVFLVEGVVKYKDPGKPTVLINLGGEFKIRSLLDLGASVNIMPTYLHKRMGLQPCEPTSVSLQLADRSTRKCRGMMRNLIVRCKEFYYPADFILLDTDETDDVVPIILGRPFLATCAAVINCRTGQMEISFGKDTSQHI